MSFDVNLTDTGAYMHSVVMRGERGVSDERIADATEEEIPRSPPATGRASSGAPTGYSSTNEVNASSGLRSISGTLASSAG